MSARGAHGQTLRSGCYPNPWPRDLLRGGHGNRALDRQGDALDVGDELHVERDVQAVSTMRSSGIFDGLNHDAEHRESRTLNIGSLGLTRAVTGSMVEESACAFFRTRKTLVSTNCAAFKVPSPRETGPEGVPRGVREGHIAQGAVEKWMKTTSNTNADNGNADVRKKVFTFKITAK